MSWEMKIPPTKVVYEEKDVDEICDDIKDVLMSGQVILGPKTEQFEMQYAHKCNRLYGSAVSSDTAAFEIIMRIIFEETDRRFVLFPALGFYSIIHSILRAGGRPVLIDMDLGFNLYPSAEAIDYTITQFERVYGKALAALVVMHTGGLIAGDVENIKKVCKMHEVFMFEDAAHCFGSTLDGKPAGSWGDMAGFSLYATKPIHTCEGGVIVTDRVDWKDSADCYRNYGRSHKFGISIGVKDGSSWRLTEMQAVLGLHQLKNLDRIILDRRNVGAKYDMCFEGLTDSEKELFDEYSIRPVAIYGNMKSNCYRYVMMSSHPTALMGLEKKFLARGIQLPGKVYDLPVHRQPAMISKLGKEIIIFEDLDVSEMYCDNHFCLPVYQGMTDNEVLYVMEALKDIVREIHNEEAGKKLSVV